MLGKSKWLNIVLSPDTMEKLKAIRKYEHKWQDVILTEMINERYKKIIKEQNKNEN